MLGAERRKWRVRQAACEHEAADGLRLGAGEGAGDAARYRRLERIGHHSNEGDDRRAERVAGVFCKDIVGNGTAVDSEPVSDVKRSDTIPLRVAARGMANAWNGATSPIGYA